MGHTTSNSAAGGGGGKTKTKTTSSAARAIVRETAAGSIAIKIAGHSRTKGTGVGNINSSNFHVRGHSWHIAYYPDGERQECLDWVSIYLCLDRPAAAATTDDVVTVEFKLSLLDGHYDETVYEKICPVKTFSFVNGYSFIHHVGGTQDSSRGMRIKVGGKLFAAHRNVLVARSPVFMAELFGRGGKETTKAVATGNIIQIDDMDVRVFQAMLLFVYTDTLPNIDKGDMAFMAQHLLVAAHRYRNERLKSISLDMLRKGV